MGKGDPRHGGDGGQRERAAAAAARLEVLIRDANGLLGDLKRASADAQTLITESAGKQLREPICYAIDLYVHDYLRTLRDILAAMLDDHCKSLHAAWQAMAEQMAGSVAGHFQLPPAETLKLRHIAREAMRGARLAPPDLGLAAPPRGAFDPAIWEMIAPAAYAPETIARQAAGLPDIVVTTDPADAPPGYLVIDARDTTAAQGESSHGGTANENGDAR